MKALVTITSLFITVACLTSTASAQLAGALVINEFVASNDSTAGGYREPDGGYGDWIELFNRSNSPLNLDGVNLSDDLMTLDKWTFPAGTTLAAGGYLIVWADNDLAQTGIHANFKLGKDGEDVVLSRGGAVIDSYSYGPQETNVSEARLPNGTGAFAKTSPTPSAFNTSAGVRDVQVVRLELRPNPVTDFVEVSWSPQETFRRYGLYDAAGRCVAEGAVARGARQLRLETASLPAGTYRVTLDGGRGQGTFVR